MRDVLLSVTVCKPGEMAADGVAIETAGVLALSWMY